MSTFDGVVKEYPLISIDNFLESSKNFQSTVFFLSHCHSDHMKGLKDKKFFQLLESRGFSQIYMSDVSEHLLKNDNAFSHLSEYLVSLPIEQPTIIDIYDEYGNICSRVVVTLLTAGHCPGSVMFLLEGENGRVLYTGDFRLLVGGSARLTNLHDENGRLKPLESLYIDTTFCSNNCMYIPTREQCLLEILKLVEAWLSKGPDYIVRFICPAQYNYEFVFVEIFKKLGEKTHVFEDKLKKYKGIKVIEDAVTSNPCEARVHACVSGYSDDFNEILYAYETPCGYHMEDLKPIKVRLIKPSVMFFKQKNCTEVSTLDERTQVHRVCFATHSSLDEIRDMVKYLKPKRVHPNVVKNQTVEQILHLIGASVWNSCPDSLLPLGQLNDITNDESTISTNSFPFYDDCYEIPLQRQLPEISLFVPESPGEPQVESTYNVALQSDQTEEKATSEALGTLNISKIAPSSGKLNCDSSSPVKWECPILSSDDENCYPNSSFNNLKDKSDSEVYGTPEEQYSAALESEYLTPAKAKSLQSELSTTSNQSVQEHSERKCNGGIRFELEKLLASQEPEVDCVIGSQYQSDTYTCCGDSFVNTSLTVTTSTKSGEFKPNSSGINPAIKFNSNTYCINSPANSVEHLMKTNNLLKSSKQENSSKSAIKAHAILPNPTLSDQSVECKPNQTTWRGSKLIIEVNNELFENTPDVEIVLSEINSDKRIAVSIQKANSTKTHTKSAENIVVNTNIFSDVAMKQEESLDANISDIVNRSNKSQPFLKLPQFLDNTHLTRSIYKSDSNTISKTSTSTVQQVVGKRKLKKSTKKRKSIISKYNFCSDQLERTFEIIGCPKSKSALTELSSFEPCFSKKIQDPFASKYEKSLNKFQKKALVSKTCDNDVSILSAVNKCDKSIHLIDITDDPSDGYKSDVELFECENNDSDVIIEEDSPSLLMPTKKAIGTETNVMTLNEHLGPGRKRKSADENTLVRKKSPKPEASGSSHPVCDKDPDIDSTPEDLLPFTHTQVSSYLKRILGSEI